MFAFLKTNFFYKPAYLESIRNRMQKPVEGLLKTIEDRVGIGAKTAQKHVENYIKRGYRLLRAQQSRCK
jgi:hypothetical protein